VTMATAFLRPATPLLGIGIETAVRWTHRAKRDWQGYIQARATATASEHRYADANVVPQLVGPARAGSDGHPKSFSQVQGTEPLITPDPA
jgi:hypothetical protein